MKKWDESLMLFVMFDYYYDYFQNGCWKGEKYLGVVHTLDLVKTQRVALFDFIGLLIY